MEQLKDLPMNKFVELDSKILKNLVKPIIGFFEKENIMFSLKNFYIMKFNNEKAIIYYNNEGDYWPIVNYKFKDEEGKIFIGLKLSKIKIIHENIFFRGILHLELE